MQDLHLLQRMPRFVRKPPFSTLVRKQIFEMAKRTYRRFLAIDECQTILGRKDRNISVAHKEFRTIARWFLTVRMLGGFQCSFFTFWLLVLQPWVAGELKNTKIQSCPLQPNHVYSIITDCNNCTWICWQNKLHITLVEPPTKAHDYTK